MEQNYLEGHSICDLRTEVAQKQRHHDEEYEPSSEDPRQLSGGANRPAQIILTYFNEFPEKL